MEETISFITENLNSKRLEEITTAVINAYRNEDESALRTYAGVLNINKDAGRRKMFYAIVQRLHPDRLPVLKDEFKKAKSCCDIEVLSNMKKLLQVKVSAAALKAERFEYEHHETWNTGFDETDFDDYVEGADVFEDEEADSDFYKAVKDVIFGNHDFSIAPSDLGQIDGGLDLGYCGLEDIDGIEFCRNVRSLNISGNSISNIYDLQHLSQLEELYAADNLIRDIDSIMNLEWLEIIDLSGNEIEDITPLLNMSNLKFVNIMKNPVSDRTIIEKLEADGVIVLR